MTSTSFPNSSAKMEVKKKPGEDGEVEKEDPIAKAEREFYAIIKKVTVGNIISSE